MATLIMNDAYFVVNSVDLSDHVKSVSISYEAEAQDDTAMGDTTKSSKGGMLNWSVSVELHQDYAASKVDATIFSLVGADATAFEIRPTGDAVSATNPKFTGYGLVTSYNPIGGAVGELAGASISLVPSKGASNTATLTRATS